MTIYGHRLTERQARIRDFVCERGATLPDRLRALGQRTGLEDFADLAAVRGWLFDVHHTERQPPASVVPGGDQ